MGVTVLRLGHRKERDKRITTHCALVARAFGANKIILSGEKDEAVLESVREVVEHWGGSFKIEYAADWEKVLDEFKGTKVHLTMYGEKLSGAAKKIKKAGNVLVAIGAEKVPWVVYEKSDFNIAIGNQPHSEVAALSVFLHEILGEKKLWEKRKGANIGISPRKKGKKVFTKL